MNFVNHFKIADNEVCVTIAYRVNGKTFATILRVVPSELAPLAEAIIQCKDADFSEQCDWPHVEDEVRLLAEILKTRHDSQSHLRSANLFLILDEVFYTCCGVILVLDCLLRQFHDPSAVFGGVQSILMGDGTQVRLLTPHEYCIVCFRC